jgi:hypothetical protein
MLALGFRLKPARIATLAIVSVATVSGDENARLDGASSGQPMSIAAPSQTILTVMGSKCCTGSQWLCTEAIGAVVMLSKNPRRILRDEAG